VRAVPGGHFCSGSTFAHVRRYITAKYIEILEQENLESVFCNRINLVKAVPGGHLQFCLIFFPRLHGGA